MLLPEEEVAVTENVTDPPGAAPTRLAGGVLITGAGGRTLAVELVSTGVVKPSLTVTLFVVKNAGLAVKLYVRVVPEVPTDTLLEYHWKLVTPVYVTAVTVMLVAVPAAATTFEGLDRKSTRLN